MKSDWIGQISALKNTDYRGNKPFDSVASVQLIAVWMVSERAGLLFFEAVCQEERLEKTAESLMLDKSSCLNKEKLVLISGIYQAV